MMREELSNHVTGIVLTINMDEVDDSHGNTFSDTVVGDCVVSFV